MTTDLARKQLERRIAPLRNMESSLARPPRGWIKAIREALGMTTRQLAMRLGVAPSRIPAIEKGEVHGSLTLQSLREAAEALDCRLVYALVPRKPLEELLRERARAYASERLQSIHHTMHLENQAMEGEDFEAERERLIDDLIKNDLRHLWSQL